MDYQKLIFPVVVVTILFISAGDKLGFLPEPVKNASRQSRSFVMGLLPDWVEPTDRNSEREQQIEQLEQ